MGDERVREVVSDAGPLIHLEEIGSLDLLRVFERIHLPDAVWNETVFGEHVSETRLSDREFNIRHTLDPQSIETFVQNQQLTDLHTGERESLYLCKSVGIDCLLTDDLAVREASKRLNIRPIGSVGVIIRAYHLKVISIESMEHQLYQLYETSSLFVTRTIIDRAIEAIRNQ